MEDKVRCAICGAEMAAINNRHLAKHSISADEYRTRFPDSPLLSKQSAERLSQRSIQSNASRKGIPRSEETKAKMRQSAASRASISRGPMSDAQKALLSELAKRRYANGFVPPNTGKIVTVETRERIAAKLRGRAVGPEAALRAVATKRAAGHDFGSPMRGKRHSEETKTRIGEQSSRWQRAQRGAIRGSMEKRIAEANLTLVNEIVADFFELRCNVCQHTFTRTSQCFQPSKYKTAVCDQCFPRSTVSEAENAIASRIAQMTDHLIIRSDRQILAPLELDIWLPEQRLAVEYCGLYYHSASAGRSKWYHKYKLKKCREHGVRLLTVFEDEWLHKRPIVESMLRNACGTISQKLNARQCNARAITSEESAHFLNTNHIQGRGRNHVRYGLFWQDELVSVMTFLKGDRSHGSTGWEINRFASKLDHSIRGGAGRLFKMFLSEHDADQVTSFADLRWGTGAVYGHLGFELVGESVPNYWYIKGTQRLHRFALRKTADDPRDQTEMAIRAAQGWTWIFDCGHAKWVWTRPDLVTPS